MKSCLLMLGLAMAATAAVAAKPHEHGAAKLDVAIEARRVTFELEAPLDNLVGFERAPRSDEERRRADAAVATLKAAAALFRLDPAAQCTLATVELVSAPLGLGQADADEPEGHADLDGSFAFDCVDAGKAAALDVGLFDAFPRLQRLDVQVAGPQGQFKRTLKRGATRVVLKK